MTVREQAIAFAVARTNVAVYHIGPSGEPCVRIGKIVSVTDRHVLTLAGRQDNPQAVPITAITRIDSQAQPKPEPEET